MFPISVINYVKMGLCVLLLAGAWYFGYSFEHSRFVKFQAVVREEAQKQIAENEAKVKEQEIINKGVQDAYEARIASIHAMYNGMHNTSSSAVSSVPNATLTINGNTVNTLDFAEQCANTTQQLESLQDWVNQQVGLK
jgi:hypothetical protein